MQRYAGAIIHRDKKVLLGLRSSHKSVAPELWDIFGGHVEADEDPAQTLIRELQEELSITPNSFALITVLTAHEETRVVKLHVFSVDDWTGQVQNSSDEHSEISWFDHHGIKSIPLALASYLELFQSTVFSRAV